jgi:hypothetical protein
VNGSVVEATYNHPFWVAEKRTFEWAQDLVAGEHLLLADGRTAPITAVSRHDETTTVYNLSIAFTHTFFVGEQSALVHNSCGSWVGGKLAAAGNKIGDTGGRAMAFIRPAVRGDVRGVYNAAQVEAGDWLLSGKPVQSQIQPGRFSVGKILLGYLRSNM